MTLIEFRNNPKLVKGAIQISSNDIFKEMMKVVWSEHPLQMPVSRKVGVDEKDPSYQLGTIDGATRVLQVIQSLTMPIKKGVELKPTYEPPEQD